MFSYKVTLSHGPTSKEQRDFTVDFLCKPLFTTVDGVKPSGLVVVVTPVGDPFSQLNLYGKTSDSGY